MIALFAALALASSPAESDGLFRYKKDEQSRWASPDMK